MMLTFINNLNLRWRILLMTTLILLGFLLSQIAYFRYVSTTYFREEVRQETNRIIENVKEDIDNFSEQIYRQMTSIYQDTDFMRKLGNREFDYKDKLYAHSMVVKSPLMSKIYALYIYDDSHNLISNYRKATTLKYPFPYDLYAEKTEEGENLIAYIDTEQAEMAVLGYESGEKREKTIRYVLRLYQNRGSQFVGYMVCDVASAEIEHILERNIFKEEQYLWLETLNEYPIIFSEEADEKGDYYSFTTEESFYGYRVHSLSTVSYLEKNAREFLRNVVGMVLVLVLIWGSVLVITSKKMTQYQEKIILNDARYYALQSQINPHFLFNTLSTMAGIAGMEASERVKKMCEVLSDIFRYNIAGNIDKKYVSLQEELEHIRNYLYIVEMRTMEPIGFQVNIPEELMDIRIPKLSLQPLVENSVNHGLRKKRGEKYIHIGAQQDGQKVLVNVTDNGVMTDVQKMEECLKGKGGDSSGHTSIGLRNINERIQILFGTEYGISFICTEVTKVTVKIPLFRGGEDEEKI